MSSTARRRILTQTATAIITGVISLGTVGLPVSATAVPPTLSPLPGDQPAGAGARVYIEEFTPRDVTADSPSVITVRGTVTNSGADRLESVRLRLQRGAVITTRSELHQVDNDAGPLPPVRWCDWLLLPDGLAPGQSTRFEYRCPMQDLAMTLIGIYPLVLRAEATLPDGAGYEPVGETHTYLPSFPDGVTARTQVSWLWPLVDRPHRTGRNAQFVDDDLAGSVSAGGRLDRLLSIAEHAAPGMQLTLVVDPALIDDLVRMERGYQVRGRPGRHGPAARAWLDRLKRLAASHPVVTLPYGDPDIVALQRGGIADMGATSRADVSLVADRLGVSPVTTLAWPPDEMITPAALDTLLARGTRAVVLNAASLPNAPVTGPTRSAVAALHTADGGQAVALVSDPYVEAAVREAAGHPGGPRLAEQRFLTELAMITAEAPSRGRELIVVPPRRWDPDPVSALAMLDDTVSMSWLTAGSAVALANQRPQVDRGALVYPQAGAQAELPAEQIHTAAAVAAQVRDFRSALLDADSAKRTVDPLESALRYAVSSAWRNDHRRSKQLIDSLQRQIQNLRAGVHIVEPSGSGVYSLASSDSPLFLTVANRLDVPVRFRLEITSRGASGLSVDDIGEQVIQAHTRRTIRVPAHVERAGVFIVDALIVTPDGQPLGRDGAPVQLKVRSTAYGVIGLSITGAALALFLLLGVRRLVRHWRRRGDNSTPTDSVPGPDDDLAGGSMYGAALAGEATLGGAFTPDIAYIPAERSSA